jgi:hypothetical protein
VQPLLKRSGCKVSVLQRYLVKSPRQRNVACLPEVAGGAALLFDPYSVEGVVATLGRMATEPTSRADLRTKREPRLGALARQRRQRRFSFGDVHMRATAGLNVDSLAPVQ